MIASTWPFGAGLLKGSTESFNNPPSTPQTTVALADYQTLVDSLVRDASGTLTSMDRDRAIELARLRISADAPRELVKDVTWVADGYFGPLPDGWADGAWIKSAEYPVGRQPLELVELAVYADGAAQQLMAGDTLPAGSVVRVVFSAPHLLSTGVDTIPAECREAVGSYAAYLLCRQLATHYSGERDASIGADASNTESRARNYAARAKEYRAAYYAGIGKADPQLMSAGGSSGTGSGGAPAASTSGWDGRTRAGLRNNSWGL